MKILFMGTGADDYKIKERKDGEFFRRNSTALINDDLMVDCSSQVQDFTNENPTDLSRVENVLLTHSHSDHYSPDTIKNVLKKDIRVWSEEVTEKAVVAELDTKMSILPLYEEVTVGKYKVTAMPANHRVENPAEQPLCYMISDGEKRIFWGGDGSWLITDTWKLIQKYKFDLMIFDGTFGDIGGDERIFEHNSIPILKCIFEAVRNQNLLTPNGLIYITHMSKYSQLPHDELVEKMKELGAGVTYDGFVLEI